MILTARTREEAECVLDAAYDEGIEGEICYHAGLDGAAGLGFVKLHAPLHDRWLLKRLRCNPHFPVGARILNGKGELA